MKKPSKYLGNVCPTVASTEAISLCYQLPLCFVFIFIGRGSLRHETVF